MKYLWISPNGDTVDIARRVIDGGDKVRFFIPEQHAHEDAELNKIDRHIGDGIVPKISDWKSSVDWADVIIIDAIGKSQKLETGKIADALRKRGKKVFGAGSKGEEVELDRHRASELMDEHGVQTISSEQFKDFDAGTAFLKSKKGRYAFKPNANVDSEFTYVAKSDDSSDLVAQIEKFKQAWPSAEPVDFDLQKFTDGVEIDVGGFFNGKDWMRPLWVQFEHKRFAASDVWNPRGMGFQTGEMGSTHFWSPTDTNRFFDETLKKMRSYFEEIGFHGWLDINALVNEQGVWPLEFTTRFGLPEAYVLTETLGADDWGSLLHNIAAGSAHDFAPEVGKWGTVVRLVSMGFPFAEAVKEHSLGHELPVKDGESNELEHVHFEYSKRNEDGKLVVGSVCGIALAVTGKGDTLQESIRECYSRIGPMASSVYWYRPDIGERNIEDLNKLAGYGYTFGHPESQSRGRSGRQHVRTVSKRMAEEIYAR